jgi:hypothetical protein
MKYLRKILITVLVALTFVPVLEAVEEQEVAVPVKGEGLTLLGAGSRWKRNFVFFPPKVSEAAAEELRIDPKDLQARSKVLYKKFGKRRKSTYEYLSNLYTGVPADNWMMPDYNDSDWLHDQAQDFQNYSRSPIIKDNEKSMRNTCSYDEFVKEIGLITQRGKFIIKDPAKVKKLTLTLVYRGGFVAYLNGKEVARAHLPKGRITPYTGAETYPQGPVRQPETKGKKHKKSKGEPVKYSQSWITRHRHQGPLEIDTSSLKKGVNVLAIEIHRSDYEAWNTVKGLKFAAIGMSECYLQADAPADAVVSSFDRPDGLKAWNQHLWETSWDTDFGNPAEPLCPIRIVAAQNGTFSGQVMVGSTKTIKGLNAMVSSLKTKDGKALPREAIRVRYGITNPTRSKKEEVFKKGFSGIRFDGLLDSAPETIKPAKFKQTKAISGLLGVPQAIQATAAIPVWVTVQVPKDAAPGEYNGLLTVRAEGSDAVTVSVQLSVVDWALPDFKDYGSFFFIYQSPETLAQYYSVEPWSEPHWAMIESSLKLMGEAGNIGLIFPMQAESCLGNPESMIPWIKKADGTFDYDFSRFDRYLETALKYHHPDRLKVLAINVWGFENRDRRKTDRKDANVKNIIKNAGKERVWEKYESARTKMTVIDKAAGTMTNILMPPYGTPEAEAMWKPVLLKVKARLEAKDLYSKAMLGLPGDTSPAPSHVAMFRNILGDIPWFRESHFDKRTFRYDPNDKTKVVPVGCNSIVWGGGIPDPKKKRLYGWRYNPKHMILNFNRAGTKSVVLDGRQRAWCYRMWMESTIGVGRNGNGRCGGDFFRAGYTTGSGNKGCLFGFYPRSATAQTGLGNNVSDLFAPGPKGPVTSVRFENAREGNQETEAKILIEKALLNKEKPLPAELAEKCQKLLDYRTNIMRLWQVTNGSYKTKLASTGWQDCNLSLFQLAGEVARSQQK